MSAEDRAQRERQEAQAFRAVVAQVVTRLDRLERARVLTPALSQELVQVIERHEAANQGALSLLAGGTRRGPMRMPTKGGAR